MMSAKGLHCRRGGRTVIAGLSFELHPGQVIELCGANGSGKTSLLRLLAGLGTLSGGELLWDGRALRPNDSGYEASMAYLGHQNGLSAELSAAENLCFSQQLCGGSDPKAALQIWDLAMVANQPVRHLSQGQRRRLALARVWLGQRMLWLLDEPCAALDSAGEQLFNTCLAAHLKAGGMAVVATHHALAVAAAMLQRVDMNTLPGTSSQGILAAC